MEEVVAVVVEAEEGGENRYRGFLKKSSIYFVSNISFHGLCPFQECALRISMIFDKKILFSFGVPMDTLK